MPTIETEALQAKAGKELILATRPFAHDNPVRSWWVILSSMFLLVVALTGTLWNLPFGAKLGFSLFAGLMLTRLFVIYHDQQHHALLPRSRLAEGLMRVFGILVLCVAGLVRADDFIVYSFYGHKREHMAQVNVFKDTLKQRG